MSLSAIAHAAVSVVARLAAAVAPAGARSVLRLKELVEYRSSAEDLDLFEARPFEATPSIVKGSSPLPPLYPRRVSPDDFTLLAVDSSSRHVETAAASIVVGAVSVSGHGVVEVLDWPSVHVYPHEPAGQPPPFIRILPNSGEPRDLGLPPWATERNPAGKPYHRDYSIAQAMDEARVDLENWALAEAAGIAGASRHRAIVFVDGPLFTVPGALVDPRAPEDVAEAWGALVASRVKALEALERAGAAVVGVVKRLKSSILSRAFRGAGARCAPTGDYSDELVIHQAIASGCAKRRRGQIYRTAKVEVRVPGIPGAPSKIVEFLAIPPGAWQEGSRGLSIVRLEYTRASLRRLRSWGIEPHQAYSLASIALGSALPLPLLASDKRSRSIASALARLVSLEAGRLGIPIDYESMWEEAGEVWRRPGL